MMCHSKCLPVFSINRGIGKTNKEKVTKIEDALFPVIQLILQNDVSEFLPYVFQVLSLTLEIRVDGVQGSYLELFPLLLQPVLWERQGNNLLSLPLKKISKKNNPTK